MSFTWIAEGSDCSQCISCVCLGSRCVKFVGVCPCVPCCIIASAVCSRRLHASILGRYGCCWPPASFHTPADEAFRQQEVCQGRQPHQSCSSSSSTISSGRSSRAASHMPRNCCHTSRRLAAAVVLSWQAAQQVWQQRRHTCRWWWWRLGPWQHQPTTGSSVDCRRPRHAGTPAATQQREPARAQAPS